LDWDSAQFIFLILTTVSCVLLTVVSYVSHVRVLFDPGQDPQLTRQASTAWFATTSYALIPGP